MFEKYTDKARRAVFFARYEAIQMGVPAIDTEHLLLGVLREDAPALARFFPFRTSLAAFRRQVARRTPFRRMAPVATEIPLSAEAKQVLRLAAEEADALSQSEVEPGHLLLGLLREKRSLGATLLRENEVEYAAVRGQMGVGAEG